MKIMLIDDEAHIGRVNRDLLIQEGMAPDDVTAFDGAAPALVWLDAAGRGERQPPDVIVLDIYMPGMNGWEFLDEFEGRGYPFRDRVQVFILSASRAARDVEHAAAHAGIRGFYRKPLDRTAANELMSAGTLARRGGA